ncbi:MULTISPECIES: hypothetical protein [Streptomycetaceae]|uniref:Uncharacterized protein n=1 Tax=Streptantibioticus cattleyicolor (strain ATCC 35852 / DSM 46488 / JCM 4925 / NBRC 14057 / NRRL 8057) TaxID=1003195 RepID=G8WTB9_STREN|nr:MULTISPECIES: hypothetical protein [Streptomycetaceae]AEW93002.1 hypothetical protein SCATT_06310 [Streptantibioticus cattleyicolor NRRL 8057 = DSM 46488]
MSDAPTSAPSAEEVARAHAYLAAASAGFYIPLEDWAGREDGTATTGTYGDGTTLTHHPRGIPFELAAPCARHTTHTTRLRWPHELKTALQEAEACSTSTEEHPPPSAGWFVPRVPPNRPAAPEPTNLGVEQDPIVVTPLHTKDNQ